MRTHIFLRFILLILTAVCTLPTPAVSVTGLAEREKFESALPATLPSLNTFISSVKNGQSSQLGGVYIPGVLAIPIVQQPGDDAGYVSTRPSTITQFGMAGQYNSIGLLAHDFLAGASFSQLQPNNDVVLVFGDGSLKYYRVYEIQRYQALSPASPYSNFIDLSSNTQLTAEQLFLRTYGKGNATLVFQTCISTDKVSSWGRLFVLARPVEASQPSLIQALMLIEQAFLGASRSLSPMKKALTSH